jgi:hypothetical protein
MRVRRRRGKEKAERDERDDDPANADLVFIQSTMPTNGDVPNVQNLTINAKVGQLLLYNISLSLS